MEQNILDIIDKKAERQYARLSETKKIAYRLMLYAGVQVTINGYTVRDIASQIGYSESGTSKLVQKWIELMRDGDVTVQLIINAVNRVPKCKRMADAVSRKRPIQPPKPSVTSASLDDVKQKTSKIVVSANKPKSTKINGFVFTEEDEIRYRAAIRSSILFFQNFGKGAQPRMNGEYYSPGTNPNRTSAQTDKWLTLEVAALYCGCDAEVINNACQCGLIERRVYKRNASRSYYEYKVEDLDKFIKANNL